MRWKKPVDLILIVEEGKRLYVLIKEINTCMYDHILYHGKDFYRYCLQAFSTEEILNVILEIASKLMVSKWWRCLKKVNMLNSKILKENKITIYDLCGFSKYISTRW